MDKLAQLEALAREATPEHWQRGTAGSPGTASNLVAFGGDDIIGIARVGSERNLDYIAAANPRTILALIAVVRAADAMRGDKPFGDPVYDLCRAALNDQLEQSP